MTRKPDPSSDDFEDRLARIFAEGGKPTDALSGGAAADAERLVQMAVLDEVLEQGLELLERQGVGAVLGQLEPGGQIANYRLIQQIGAGGMGVVYLAEDTRLTRLVALKVLSRATDTTKKRFQREAEITARLQHPNIVPVYDVGESDGIQFIAMRYIAGDDAEGTLVRSREEKSTSAIGIFRRAVAVAGKIADALHHAHGQKVLHRDVKPSNILVEDDEPFILDFGLATHDNDLSLTQAGDLLGTVPYMSPEQVRGELDTLDARSDIYSLGATLFQLLAGTAPFTGRSSQVIARQILTRDPPPLRRFGVPFDLEAVVFKAMEKDRERRYETAREFANDLRRFLDGVPVRARRLGPARRTLRVLLRHKKTTAATLVFIIALMTVLVANNRASTRRRQAARAVVASADGAASSFRYAEAVQLMRPLWNQGELDEAAFNRYKAYRLRADYDRSMELLYASRDSSADELSDIADRLLGRGQSADKDTEDLFYRAILHSVVRRDSTATAELLKQWESEHGGVSRGSEAARLFCGYATGVLSGSTEGIARALLDKDISDPTDQFLSATLLALIPGAESDALDEINQFLVVRPRHFWGRFVKGNVFLALGRNGEAEELYSGLIAQVLPAGFELQDAGQVGKLRAVFFQRGLARFRKGNSPGALLDFERSGEDRPAALPHRAMSVAAALFRLGRFREAREGWQGALTHIDNRVVPANRPAVLQTEFRGGETSASARAACKRRIGASYAAEKDWEAASAVLDALAGMRGYEVEGEEALAELRLAQLRAEGGDELAFAELAAEIGALIDEYPSSLVLRALRVRVLSEWTDSEQAFDEADDLVQLFRGEPLAMLSRGLFLFRIRERFEMAMEDRILNDAESKRLAMQLELMVDHTRRASDDLGSLSRNQIASLEALGHVSVSDWQLALGAVRLWNGEPRTALRLLDESLAGSTQPAAVWTYIGDARRKLGWNKKALDGYMAAVRIASPRGLSLSRAGRLAAQTGSFKLALEVLRSMTERAPDGWDVRLELERSEYDSLRDRVEFKPYF